MRHLHLTRLYLWFLYDPGDVLLLFLLEIRGDFEQDGQWTLLRVPLRCQLVPRRDHGRDEALKLRGALKVAEPGSVRTKIGERDKFGLSKY